MTIDLITTLVQLMHVAHLLPGLVQASGDDAPVWLLAAGPVGAAGTYWAFYRYYRNTDKSHEFERDTIIDARPVQGGENKVDHISRTRDSDIKGDNSDDYRKRVQRVG